MLTDEEVDQVLMDYDRWVEPRYQHEAIRFVLDGLGVESLAEARRLVELGREHEDDFYGHL